MTASGEKFTSWTIHLTSVHSFRISNYFLIELCVSNLFGEHFWIWIWIWIWRVSFDFSNIRLRSNMYITIREKFLFNWICDFYIYVLMEIYSIDISLPKWISEVKGWNLIPGYYFATFVRKFESMEKLWWPVWEI